MELPGRGARARASEESGLGLVEVLVSVAMVALTAVGIFMGLDAASGTSGSNKARAIAAGIAQQDQEQLRAMRLRDVSNLRRTRVQPVAGVNYTVVSRADWVTDDSGSASCSTNTEASYVKITSTVTWPVMRGLNPVVIESIIAPPNGSFGTNQGSLAVQVQNADGNPLPGQVVQLSGNVSFAETTNANGCVLIGYIPSGPGTTVTVDPPGPTPKNPEGDDKCVIPADVIPESVTQVVCELDDPGAVNVSFRTRPFLNSLIPPALANPQAGRGEWVMFSHPSMPPPGSRKMGDGVARATQSTGMRLMPYPSPYLAYAGACSAAQPGANGNAASPITQTVQVTRGGTAAVTVWEPAVNVLVTRLVPPLLNSVPVASARVFAKSRECGVVTEMGSTNLLGQLDDPGLPFGSYDICVETLGQTVRLANVQNRAANGTALIPIIIPTTGLFDACERPA